MDDGFFLPLLGVIAIVERTLEVVVRVPLVLHSAPHDQFFTRAFYIPYVSDKSNQFGRYVLLQRRSTVDSKVPHCCRLTMGTASIERPAYPTVVRGEQPSASSTQDQVERTRLPSEKRERERHEKEERAKSEEEAQRTREREAAKAQQAAADKERHEDEERRRMIEEYEAKLAAESEQREAESDAKAVQQESEELHKKWEDIKQTEAELDASPSVHIFLICENSSISQLLCSLSG